MLIAEICAAGDDVAMLNQRHLIEAIFPLPRVMCALMCSTILVLGFYANDVSDAAQLSNVASVTVEKSIYKNDL